VHRNTIRLFFFFLFLSNSVYSQNIFRSVCQGNIGRVDSLINESQATINQQDQYGNTPLHFAVYCKKVEVLKRLLERKASVEAMDNHGRTPLFYASMRNDLAGLDQLLAHQANPNVVDVYGDAPIHQAVLYGHLDIARKLIESGAIVNMLNKRGSTPLRIAVREENEELVQMLLTLGADQDDLNLPVLKGKYFGQEKPGSTPVMFAPGFISTEMPQLDAVFHPNGKEFYYSIETSEWAMIMCTKLVNDHWTRPAPATFSGDYREVDLFITKDGSKLFYCSYRPVHEEDSIKDNPDLWMVERAGDDWGSPIHLGKDVNSDQEEWYPTVSDQGTLYLSVGQEREGTSNICFSKMVNGQYGKPIFLPDAVNSDVYDYDPFIAPDESYLIFASKRPGGLGDSDLYISYRNEDGSWSKAKNLGENVNSPSADFTPIISPDGKYFFFTSWRAGTGDIYWVEAKTIFEN